MKKLLLAIFFCLIPFTLIAGGGCTAIMAGASGAAACSKGATILAETFESGYTNDAEWGGISDWTESPASTNIFLADSDAPVTATMSGYIHNVSEASTDNYLYKAHTAINSGYATWRIRFKSADVTGYTNQTTGPLFFVSEGDAATTSNRTISFWIYNEKLWYYDNTTFQDVGSLSDNTEYNLSAEMNIDDSDGTACVRIWLNGVEVTYHDADGSGETEGRTAYDTRARRDPEGTDRLSFQNKNTTTFGDITVDDILIYGGNYCATGDPS